MKIFLTESQFRELLKENRESKNQKIARNLMRDKGLSDEHIKQTYEAIRTDIPNSRVCQYSYFPMITRMYLDGQIKDGETINSLNQVLFVIGNGKVSKIVEPTALFNATPQQFIDTYADDVKTFNYDVRNRVNSKEYNENHRYTIVQIDNPKEASKYGDFTDWCVTHNEGMYDNYTNDGSGRFYFCLRDDYQNVPRKIGEGCPLDDYGLSMIAVSVDIDGNCNTVTCRWNHDNGGNDHIMNEEQVSDLIGRNFFKTFLPYTDEEQIEKGNITSNMALRLLEQGENPEDVFDEFIKITDNIAKIKLNKRFNIVYLSNPLYLCEQWYDGIGEFINGFASVYLTNILKFNAINAEFKEVSNKWYDIMTPFSENFCGLAAVMDMERPNKCNFINKNGEIVFKRWFDNFSAFNKNGFSEAIINGEKLLIDAEGNEYDIETHKRLNERKRVCKKIFLKESQFKELLKENRESKNQKIARNLMKERGLSDEQIKKTYEGIRNDIPNSRVCQYSYFPMITRMCLDTQIKDGETINKLNKTLFVIGSGKVSKNIDPSSLFNATPQQFIDTYANDVKAFISDVRNSLEMEKYNENPRYTIVQIDNPEEASKYGDFTDWCVTHNEGMYNRYTNDGIGRFYFCLRDDYQNVPREVGEGCPLDDYGLSMIAVSVDGDGNCNTVTCRWNHDNGGTDHIMDEKQVSNLIGRNFFKTFLPYTDEEQMEKGNLTPNTALKLLQQGKKPEEVFEGVKSEGEILLVVLNDKLNFLTKENQYLSPIWFDFVGAFRDGFAKVYFNGKENFVDKEGHIVFEQWYDGIKPFVNGIAIVNIDYEYNIIDKNGNLLSPQWFEYIEPFHNGFARVTLDEKDNFINEKGQLVSQQWFENVGDFETNGLAEVYLNGKENYINKNGHIQFRQWFDSISTHNDGNSFVVTLNGKWNLVDKEGVPMSQQWFDHMEAFRRGFANVSLDGKENFMREDGQLLSQEWFDNVDYFNYEGIAMVQLNNKCNYIKEDGQILSKIWFDKVDYFDNNGFAMVSLDNKSNYIKENGQLLSQLWFDKIKEFNSDDLAKVELDGKFNLLKIDGQLLSQQWFDYTSDSLYNGYFREVIFNDEMHYIDNNGRLYDSLPSRPMNENIKKLPNKEFLDLMRKL